MYSTDYFTQSLYYIVATCRPVSITVWYALGNRSLNGSCCSTSDGEVASDTSDLWFESYCQQKWLLTDFISQLKKTEM